MPNPDLSSVRGSLIGRSLFDLLDALGVAPTQGWRPAVVKAVSVQTIFVMAVAANRAIAQTNEKEAPELIVSGAPETLAAAEPAP